MEAETQRYQFDNVEVQPAAFSVRRAGQTLELEPKALRVLLYLIEHRDRAVPKEELIESVWEGAAVTDNALTRIVAQLRRELGDDARQPRYIQTLPTLGYRFIADLQVTPQSTAIREAPVPPPPLRRQHLLLGAAAAALVGGAVLWWMSGRGAVHPSAEFHPVQLTTSPGLDLSGSFSPDGRYFTYSSNRSGWFQIYVRPVEPGGAERQITSDTRQGLEPAWSPDGKSIAYHSAAERGIWLIPASGGTPRRLTEFGSAPAWSPDGRQIAFRSFEPYSLAWFDFGGAGGDSTIWVVAADGSQLKRLTSAGTPPGEHAMPNWTPDGKRVTFVSLGPKYGIWTVDPYTSSVERFRDSPLGRFSAPLFNASPASRYFTGVSAENEFAIYGASATGGDLKQLYSMRDDVPMGLAVSPDGKRLIYTRVATVSQLWITGANGADAKSLYEDSVVRAKLPSFSPDGKRLAYVVRPEGRDEDLWMMNADGSGAAVVAADPGPEMAPGWTADGGSVLYSYSDAGKYEMRRIDLATRARRTLFEASGGLRYRTHVTPDQRDLIYDAPMPSNIWKLALPNGAPKQLTFDREGASFPVLSWDGQWIAYEARRGDAVQIGLVNRAGGPAQILTEDNAVHWPNSWAADNRRIAYAAYRDGAWNLYWIDRTTRQIKQITHHTAYGSFVRNPAWRPGTEQLAYEYSQVRGNVYLVTLR